MRYMTKCDSVCFVVNRLYEGTVTSCGVMGSPKREDEGQRYYDWKGNQIDCGNNLDMVPGSMVTMRKSFNIFLFKGKSSEID